MRSVFIDVVAESLEPPLPKICGFYHLSQSVQTIIRLKPGPTEGMDFDRVSQIGTEWAENYAEVRFQDVVPLTR